MTNTVNSTDTSDLPVPYRNKYALADTYPGMVLIWEYRLNTDEHWRVSDDIREIMRVKSAEHVDNYVECVGEVHKGYQLWIPEWKATKLGLKDIREGTEKELSK